MSSVTILIKEKSWDTETKLIVSVKNRKKYQNKVTSRDTTETKMVRVEIPINGLCMYCQHFCGACEPEVLPGWRTPWTLKNDYSYY